VDDDEKEKKTVKESYLSDTLAKRPASNVGGLLEECSFKAKSNE
jgi:hypothetical protein